MAKRKKVQVVEENKLREEAVALAQRLIDNSALRAAVDELVGAANAAEEAVLSRKRKRPLRKLVLVTGLAGAVVLGVYEPARAKLLDVLFGAEEDFEYNGPPPGGEPGSPLTAV